MADGTIQVRNEELNEMRCKSEAARKKREQSARELDLARQRLQTSENELADHSKLDSRELHRAVKEEERKVLRELDNVGRDLQKEILQQNAGLRGELADIRRSVAGTNEEIDRVNGRIQDVSRQFESRIRSISERMRKQGDRARLYANQLQDVLDRIGELHSGLLTPGEAELIQEAMEFVITDIKNEDYQAAIGLSQANLPTAIELQARLERLNDEFNKLSVSIAEAIVRIREQITKLTDIDANVKYVHIVIGNKEFDFRYNGDLNHWSNGLFYQLCNNFDRLAERVRDEYIRNMDLQNMRIADKDIPLYSSRFERCASFAEEEFNISCRVQGTAERIHDALTEDDSWTLLDSGFEQNDDRRSYHSSYGDGQGNRSAIVIIPSVIRNGRNGSEAQFSVGACDGEQVMDAAMCRILRDAIIARLRHCGISTDGGEDYRQSNNAEAFINQIYTLGDGIKTERLRQARNQMKL